MIKKINFKKIDWFTIVAVFFIFAIGATYLYSATSMREVSSQFESQIIKFIIGIIIIFIISHINPVLFKSFTPQFYFISLILIISVPFFGVKILGARRWLDLYFIQFQPSEIMKLAIPAMIAFLVSKIGSLDSSRKLTLIFFVVVIPAIFILNQPDLGTTILILATSSILILCSGITTRFLISTAVISSILIFTGFKYLIKDYQIDRIKTLFNPELDPLGSGYHITQSKIAIGSGGITGKGFMEGTQSQLNFIPEQSTDFILAVFLEETGFLGFVALSISFIMLLGRLIYMSYKIQDVYSKLLSISITSTIFLYAFINIGMVIGILPVVGVPLPFFSYGGSSILTTMACIGIVMNFYTNRNIYQNKI